MDRSAKPVAEEPVWTRTAQRRKPALTREAIVAAAIDIADAEGLAAVSIRRVAAELGARAMSLYSHFDRKEDLLNLMGDEVVREVLIEDGRVPANWREALTTIARLERSMMLRHSWIIELQAQRTEYGPNVLRHLEQSLAAVDGLNVDPEMARAVVGTVDHFVLGCTRREIVESAAEDRFGMSHQKRVLLMLDYLREQANAGGFTRLLKALDSKTGAVHDHSEKVWDTFFERGLSWLLDGIERDLVKD
jgi:AcrR family transcriptional regulator